MTTTRISRATSGELVRQTLMQAQPAGLSTDQLVQATELSPNQVRNGLLWIRETAAAEHLTPLTHTRRDGYRFSQDPNDWKQFENAQLRRILTMVLRTFTGVVDPHSQLLPDDDLANYMNAQFNSVRQTIQMTLNNQNPGAGPPPRTPTPA